MTSKEYVQSKLPKAKAERHRTNGPFGKPYWLIRDGNAYMYLVSSDKSESNAWVKAKTLLKKKEAKSAN